MNEQMFKFLIEVIKGEKTSFSVQSGVSIIFKNCYVSPYGIFSEITTTGQPYISLP